METTEALSTTAAAKFCLEYYNFKIIRTASALRFMVFCDL